MTGAEEILMGCEIFSVLLVGVWNNMSTFCWGMKQSLWKWNFYECNNDHLVKLDLGWILKLIFLKLFAEMVWNCMNSIFFQCKIKIDSFHISHLLYNSFHQIIKALSHSYCSYEKHVHEQIRCPTSSLKVAWVWYVCSFKHWFGVKILQHFLDPEF